MSIKVLSILAAIILAASFIFSPDGLPNIPICWFKNMTNLPCPGCGMTHSISAISHGQFTQAWNYHPFGFILYPIFLLCLSGPLIVWKIPKAEEWLLRSKVVIITTIILIAAIVTFGLCRLVSLMM